MAEATDNKYDRSIRVWGTDGQKAIVYSHVLLVGADALGSETLKNLVLPGVGHFTIADDHLVDKDDVASNFLVDTKQIGMPRAKVVYEFLSELNADSIGSYIQIKDWEDFLHDYILKDYDLIVASNLPPIIKKAPAKEGEKEQIINPLDTLAKYAENNGKTLVVLKSFGLVGSIRIYQKEHVVLDDMNEDKKIFDMRLNRPFEELIQFSKKWTLGFEGLNHKDLAHIPYAAILMHALYKFMQDNKMRMPGEVPKGESKSLAQTYKTKDIEAMRAYIKGIYFISNGPIRR